MVLVGVSQEEANLTEGKAKQFLTKLHRYAQKNKDAKQELGNTLAEQGRICSAIYLHYYKAMMIKNVVLVQKQKCSSWSPGAQK